MFCSLLETTDFKYFSLFNEQFDFNCTSSSTCKLSPATIAKFVEYLYQKLEFTICKKSATITVNEKCDWAKNKKCHKQIESICKWISQHDKKSSEQFAAALIELVKFPMCRIMVGHSQIINWLSALNINTKNYDAILLSQRIDSKESTFAIFDQNEYNISYTDFKFNTEHIEPFVINYEKSLIAAKSALENYNGHIVNQWQNNCNWFAGDFKNYITKLSHAQYVTNAWLKIWEICNKYKLVKKEQFVYFDNGSLPGGSISAINHLKQGINLKWIANSLISDTALKDEFSLRAKYPTNWCMTNDIDGDVTNLSNIDKIVKKYEKQADLYLSDIGFDVSTSKQWNHQEALHCNCFTGSLYLGLKVLKNGGDLVHKFYTLFSPYSKSLLYILTLLFEKVIVEKPLSSKAINSECYFICKNYVGELPTELDVIFRYRLSNAFNIKFYKNDHLPCLSAPAPLVSSKQMPDLFMEEYYKLLHNMTNFQLKFLHRLHYLIHTNNDQLRLYLKEECEAVVKYWLAKYKPLLLTKRI